MNLNKKLPTKKDLFDDITDLDIYRCYIPHKDFAIGKPMLSPLRDETNPSFGLFVGERNEIMFNDFLLGGGDCIRFVELMFNDTFFEAISRIIIDFDLTDKYIYKEVSTNFTPRPKATDRDEVVKQAKGTQIRKRKRDWTLRDLTYWGQFGITKEILERYNVEPVGYLFIGDKVIKCEEYTYCYIEHKDGVETYKIYQPYNKEYKWINNHNDSVWQGWAQLPKRGEKLIITKSLKDVMTIVSVTGIPAVSLQAESVTPKESVIDELRRRFEEVFLWYDNDFDKEVNWGRQFAHKLSEEFQLVYLEIPDEYECKDISDFYKKYGEKKTQELIEELLNQVPF